jgi:hypothetical protein
VYSKIPEERIFGFPTMFAVVHGPDASTIRPYPIPDRDYFARLRYCPMAKEI